MPINKNALLRYQVLDRCLRNRGRRWTWKDLQQEINKVLQEDNPKSKGVGKTTVFEDLKDLEYRVYNAEIEKIKEGKTVYLRYKDADFSINNQPLNDTEIKQLKAAVQVLSRFQGNPQFDWIQELIPVLESKLGLVATDHPVMSFDSNLDYVGLPFVTPVFNAIINKRVLEIMYQDFKSPLAFEVTLHPYHLKQFNSRWYVFGFNNSRNRIENLALDRIKDIREINENDLQYRSDETDWENYFSDFVGVTKSEGDVEEIKIFITDAIQAAYIRTNPLHQTQKSIKEVEGGFETTIKVIPNYELEKLILSLGENVKVLAPEKFKSKLSNRIFSLAHLYKD